MASSSSAFKADDFDAVRADRLEARLRDAGSEGEKDETFLELCGLYSGVLAPDSIKWAAARRMADPKNDGPEALSRALKRTAVELCDLDFSEKSLLYRLKGEIWAALGNIKEERHSRLRRRQAADATATESIYTRTRTLERTASEVELKLFSRYAWTPAQRRLIRAGTYRASGCSWEEAADKIDWQGPPESLRASFARLRRELRKRIRG